MVEKVVFIHPLSDVQTGSIGAGTRIWQFCVVLAGAVIGRDCNICSHCFVENGVIIGDAVTVKNGVSLYNGVRIEDGVFIGPCVSFANDKYPRSRSSPDHFVETRVEAGASIGAGAVVLPGVRIGRRAMIGAGAVVARDVPEDAVVYGDPARVRAIGGAWLPFHDSKH